MAVKARGPRLSAIWDRKEVCVRGPRALTVEPLIVGSGVRVRGQPCSRAQSVQPDTKALT